VLEEPLNTDTVDLMSRKAVTDIGTLNARIVFILFAILTLSVQNILEGKNGKRLHITQTLYPTSST
jgi:hypothetical protein